MTPLAWGVILALLGVGFGLWQRGRAQAALRDTESPGGGPDPEARSTLKRTQERLVQSQRLEAVGRLAGGVAHDFNNLLGVIIGHAELARRAAAEDPAVRARLDEVLAAAQRAAQLTRQLLAFSRRQVLEPRVLDLNAEVAELEPMLHRLIGDDVTLVLRLSPALGRVRADPGQIGQVLLSLASNARDAMPDGGTLTIETHDVELDEAYAREHVPLVPGSYVEIRVSDEGCGMDASVREHLFEPFFTTKPEGGGPGLGLSTVYGIVKQSGGYVWVESAPGRGASFIIQLPRTMGAVEPAASAAVPPDAGRATVLVVEDQDGLRSLICEILEEAGYRVLSAASGTEALSVSEANQEPIDLLVTDVIMPKMSGLELIRRLAETRPQTRALLMSGYTQDVIARRGDPVEHFALLRKPFTRAALLREIREALARPKE
jgi:signal transduction histidine kinase/CheY-like chemotaxis protein